MEFVELIGLMGQSLDHPALREHFRLENITKQPRPEEGEDMAFVQFAAKGYEMRFDTHPNGAQLFLRSITAYPKGDATHQPFVGKLPLDINASENRDALVARLGAPVFHNKIFKIDLWKLGDLDVAVQYDKAGSVIQNIQVNVPKKK